MSEVKLAQGTIEATAVPMTDMACVDDQEVRARNLAYWREKLAGIPAILELPTDRQRPPVQTFAAAREAILLPLSLHQGLAELGAREGTSLPVVLLAAFQALLIRYTRQDDIVVGVAQAGSEQGGDQGFGADFVVRTVLGGDPAFGELLALVNGEFLEAQEHRNVPWEQVTEAVQPDRDASRNPVFQALFSFEESPGPSAGSDSAALKVDLQLQVRSQADGLAATFVYSTDLFDGATIVRMAGHFKKLLGGIVEKPEQTVWRLPLLTEAERHQLVVEWNNTGRDYPRDLCVHQLFQQQAARTPNSTAVVFGNESLTYAELDRRSNQLAHHLMRLGAKPDSLIGICVERSLDMVVGLLGILKAGGAYVPLDPAYPRDRIAYMLENSEAPLLVTQAQLKDQLPETTARMVLIDSDWSEIARQSEKSPGLTLDPENRAYVIFTSGSTGKPKGVEVLHRGVVNFLVTMADQPGMTSSDRLLAVTTLSFDIAGLEIYLPLTLGASLEIVSREVAADGKRLLAKLHSSQATVMQATPATWRMLLEAGWTGNPQLKILIGGEAVSQKLAGQLLERSASVWNVYGPTETTIWSTTSKLEAGQGEVTIGRPIGNTEIYILDKLLQPVPIGVAGELHIGGDGLARGYLKRPDLTAEKFIAHPLSSAPNARLYKTGDLTRYLANGNIQFLGRIDHQVKIRGFRIELGEIETVLRQHPGINETVVLAREDTPGDKRVVAYFVPARDANPTTADLRAFMREKLPEYMLPSVFVTLPGMPLTPNGKVDRRALPAPDQASLAPTGTFAAPTDAVETRLCEIWESIVGVKPIGIRDNFFDLGGHSLMAVRIMNGIQEAFGKDLPIATLLQAPTVEQLAAIVRRQESETPWSCLVPIQTSGSKPAFFCIHGVNGSVVRFHSLSKYLGADQPFYGIQALGLDLDHPCHTSTEEMAAHYIREIRRVQPQGPYWLGGYSYGGAIAFEMAQQLAADGQHDTVVVLFDTNFPQQDTSASGKAASISSAVTTLFRVPSSERWKYFSRMATVPVRVVQRRLHVARLPENSKRVRGACLQAEAHYKPQPYAGRVILFRSNHKPLGQLVDPRAGWEKYVVRGLEIYEIHGNHENILLEPQVRSVAEYLKACIDGSEVAKETVLAPVSATEKDGQLAGSAV